MRFFRLTTTFLLGVFLFSFRPFAFADQPMPGSPGHPPAPAAKPAPAAAASTDDSLQPFDKVTAGAEVSNGLFNVYRTKTGKLYLEIQPSQLDVPFLCSIIMSQGIGLNEIAAGNPLNNFIFEFHRVDGQVQFVEKNPYFTADAGTPQSRAVEEDFSDSVLGSLPILSIRGDNGALIVDTGSLLLSDVANIKPYLNDTLQGDYSLDSSKTSFGNAEAFPENVEIDTVENFTTSTQPKAYDNVEALPDWRSIGLGVHYSLAVLPKDDYVPRLEDDRIGYFDTGIKDFTSNDPDTPVVRYINRWDMRKKPIVFWLENTTPRQYRATIIAAVMEWNKAFAKAGIQDAVEVKVQPDDSDWKPGDIRYNVIHWDDSSESDFAAVGPSEVNPLTGEIYRAEVVIDGEIIRRIKYLYKYEVGLSGTTSSSLAQAEQAYLASVLSRGQASRLCLLPALGANDAEVGALALALQSPHPGAFVTPDSFVKQYVRDLVMHEVGHCFGLRHNFHGSTMLSLKELNDPSITRKVGLSASVMDYLPINIAPEGEKQGDYFDTTLGPYDYWAIAYGYTPSQAKTPWEEKPMLNKIASQSGKPEYAFETDEDTYSPYSTDPNSMIFDLSSDPLGFAAMHYRVYNQLFRDAEKKLPASGKGYAQLRSTFDLLLGGYASYTDIPIKYIGGEYYSRSHKGDPGAKAPLIPIEKAEQLRALALLNQAIFRAGAISFPTSVLHRLTPDRFADHFAGVDPYVTQFSYSILGRINSLQNAVLDQLFRPFLLNRLLDAEHETANPRTTLTLSDLFQWMSDQFFSEEARGVNISDTRRYLQHDYLDHLVALVVNPSPQMITLPDTGLPPVNVASVPDDARNLAEYHLRLLRNRMAADLKRNGARLDVMTVAHLEACIKLADQALHARIEQGGGGS